MSDYIKREDALKAVDDIVCDAGDAERTCDRIIDLPSEDVAPVRHGRWVESFKVNAPPTLKERWICSWCGNVQTYGITDYCPNCGARMDAKK